MSKKEEGGQGTVLKAWHVFFVVFMATSVIYGSSVVAYSKQAYLADPWTVKVVTWVVYIHLSLLAFLQLSISYHILFWGHIWREPGPSRGLHFFSSYVLAGIGFLTSLVYYPGLKETGQGQFILNNHLFGFAQIVLLCICVSASELPVGSVGTSLALMVSYLSGIYGYRPAFIFMFACCSIYHHLYCRKYNVSVYVFALLVPTIALMFLVSWTDVSEAGLCKAMLPIHIWLAGFTFPSIFVWFFESFWLDTSFNLIFKDSTLLSILHNPFGPTAIRFKFLIPIQIILGVATALLNVATCGAIDQFGGEEMPYIIAPLVYGIAVLYVIPYVGDRFQQ